MKRLTSSIFSFEKLRGADYLYVDKTEYFWRLIEPAGESYFLSRPRRFGKSLTVSSLKAIFEGRKELFKGLAISDKPYDWKPYPVIHLERPGVRIFRRLAAIFIGRGLRCGAKSGVEISGENAQALFRNLIQNPVPARQCGDFD